MAVLRELKSSAHSVLIRWGIDIRRLRNDRKLLENSIFPYLKTQPGYQKILFVGCAWYTQHYPWIFADREFITLELDPAEARFGAPHHIIDNCENVERHFEPNSLDAVILNGVYGFGLNAMPAIEKTFNGFFNTLRPGGLFVLGWNNRPATAPYQPAEIPSLQAFNPHVFPPFGVSKLETSNKNGHTYNFYLKP